MNASSSGQGQLVRNSMASVVQIIVAGVSLFLLYAFLVREVSIEIIGVWSLSMTLASLVRIGEFGFTGSTVKYVARALAKGDYDAAIRSVSTALFSVVIGVGSAMVVIYLIIGWVLSSTFSQEQLVLAREILPFGLLFYFLTSAASVIQFALEGCHQIVTRCVISIVGTLLLLIHALILVPTFGIYGLVASQLIQITFLGFASYIALKGYLPGLKVLGLKVSKRSFQEMIRYSLSFNIISIAEIMFEPLVKYLIAGFGGLSSVVYYEMASRLVNQLRAAFVAAHKALVPYIASLLETKPEEINKVYIQSYSLLLFYGISLFSVLVTSVYLIAYIWIGRFEHEFIVFMLILSVVWFLNTLSVPAFYSNLGSGHLVWNASSYVFIVIAAWIFGHSLGGSLGALGVVLGWGLALVLGSFFVMFSYHHMRKIDISSLLPASQRYYVIGVSVVAATILFVQHFLFEQITLFPLIAPVIYSMLLFVVFWHHPFKNETFSIMANAVRGGKSLRG